MEEVETYWFVSYSYNKEGKSGFGSIEITTGELFVPSKIREYIADSIDADSVVILNYKRMQASELAEETHEDS